MATKSQKITFTNFTQYVIFHEYFRIFTPKYTYISFIYSVEQFLCSIMRYFETKMELTLMTSSRNIKIEKKITFLGKKSKYIFYYFTSNKCKIVQMWWLRMYFVQVYSWKVHSTSQKIHLILALYLFKYLI